MAALTEDAVVDCAFEIVAALDEVVSCGYREPNLTLALIKANLEMNSHEEKLSQMIRQTKESDAKIEMRRQAAAINAKKEHGASSGGPGGSQSKMEGFGSSSSSYTPPTVAPSAAVYEPAPQQPKPTMGKQGMKLVKKQRDVSEQLYEEDGIQVEVAAPTAAAAQQPITNKDPVFCLVSEQVSCTIHQDGRIAQFQVQGQVSLISRLQEQPFSVQLSNKAENYAFKPHPQVDKQKLEKQNLLCLKQQDRSLPINTAFGALKYYFNPPAQQKLDVEHIPLNLTVWPESAGGAGGVMNVNLEYELQRDSVDLFNVTICIPLGNSSEIPEVKNCSVGTFRHNAKRHQLEWVIDSISHDDDDTSVGSFEFNLAKSEPSAFFPTVIGFQSSKSLAGVTVEQVTDLRTGAPIRFGTEVQVTTDAYEVVSEE